MNGENGSGSRAYWVTVHWPNLLSDEDVHRNVYLQDGKEKVGARLKPDDQVLIYETTGGDALLVRDAGGGEHVLARRHGMGGVVAVASIAAPMMEREKAEAIEEYVGGKKRYWRWIAETKDEFSNGFVPLSETLKTLEYPPKYKMMNFGEAGSGLKEISSQQYDHLLKEFLANPRVAPIAPKGIEPVAGTWTEGGGEGPEHLLLKEYVAANPSAVLSEPGVTTLAIEYAFGTCDRADIVLTDPVGRVIGVEVEVSQGRDELEGLLQAVKYRHMLAVLFRQRFSEARALLVAYRLDGSLKKLAQEYEVQCVEIDRAAVAAWARHRQPSL